MLQKLLTKLQGEVTKHALADTKNPTDTSQFGFGVAHGKQVAFDLVEQWIQEMLEEEDDDDSE